MTVNKRGDKVSEKVTEGERGVHAARSTVNLRLYPGGKINSAGGLEVHCKNQSFN